MEHLVEGLQVTVIGMGVVFLVLYLLSVILRLFESIFYKDKIKERTPTQKNPISDKVLRQNQSIDKDILVLSAILASILENKSYNVNIKQIS